MSYAYLYENLYSVDYGYLGEVAKYEGYQFQNNFKYKFQTGEKKILFSPSDKSYLFFDKTLKINNQVEYFQNYYPHSYVPVHLIEEGLKTDEDFGNMNSCLWTSNFYFLYGEDSNVLGSLTNENEVLKLYEFKKSVKQIETSHESNELFSCRLIDEVQFIKNDNGNFSLKESFLSKNKINDVQSCKFENNLNTTICIDDESKLTLFDNGTKSCDIQLPELYQRVQFSLNPKVISAINKAGNEIDLIDLRQNSHRLLFNLYKLQNETISCFVNHPSKKYELLFGTNSDFYLMDYRYPNKSLIEWKHGLIESPFNIKTVDITPNESLVYSFSSNRREISYFLYDSNYNDIHPPKALSLSKQLNAFPFKKQVKIELMISYLQDRKHLKLTGAQGMKQSDSKISFRFVLKKGQVSHQDLHILPFDAETSKSKLASEIERFKTNNDDVLTCVADDLTFDNHRLAYRKVSFHEIDKSILNMTSHQDIVSLNEEIVKKYTLYKSTLRPLESKSEFSTILLFSQQANIPFKELLFNLNFENEDLPDLTVAFSIRNFNILRPKYLGNFQIEDKLIAYDKECDSLYNAIIPSEQEDSDEHYAVLSKKALNLSSASSNLQSSLELALRCIAASRLTFQFSLSDLPTTEDEPGSLLSVLDEKWDILLSTPIHEDELKEETIESEVDYFGNLPNVVSLSQPTYQSHLHSDDIQPSHSTDFPLTQPQTRTEKHKLKKRKSGF